MRPGLSAWPGRSASYAPVLRPTSCCSIIPTSGTCSTIMAPCMPEPWSRPASWCSIVAALGSTERTMEAPWREEGSETGCAIAEARLEREKASRHSVDRNARVLEIEAESFLFFFELVNVLDRFLEQFCHFWGRHSLALGAFQCDEIAEVDFKRLSAIQTLEQQISLFHAGHSVA